MKVLALILLCVALGAAQRRYPAVQGRRYTRHLNLGSHSDIPVAAGFAGPDPAPHPHPHPAHGIVATGQASLTGVTFHKTVPVAVAQPVPVPHLVRQLPYPVQVPVQVPVDRPVPVHVDHPVPVHVDRPVPYEVVRDVPEPVEVVEEVPVEVPVPVPHYRPVPVPHYIHKPVPVPAPYPVTILVKEHIHKKGGWLW